MCWMTIARRSCSKSTSMSGGSSRSREMKRSNSREARVCAMGFIGVAGVDGPSAAIPIQDNRPTMGIGLRPQPILRSGRHFFHRLYTPVLTFSRILKSLHLAFHCQGGVPRWAMDWVFLAGILALGGLTVTMVLGCDRLRGAK